MFKSLKRSAKGAAVPHTKATAGQPTNKMPVPEHVVIPMSMHIGAPAEPVVKKGDTVMVGTVIGKAGGFVSANIYSSVSGTVQDIAPLRMVNGAMTTAVAIKTDGAQTVDPACVPPVVTDKASLLAAVQACGLVGVGGADFPVLKQNNGLLLFSKKAAALPEPSACIRCGRCIEACPMGLEPVVIAQDFANKDFAALKARCVDLCVACGSCTYACPAKRPVSQTMGLAKGWYMAELRKGGK